MKIAAVCTAMAVLTAVLAAGCERSQNSLSAPEETSLAQGQEEEFSSGGDSQQETQGKEEEKTAEELLEEQVEQYLSGMTLEEKAAQLFVVMPEAITDAGTVTAAGNATRAALEKYPVGGLVYLKSNLVSESQTKEMLANTQKY